MTAVCDWGELEVSFGIARRWPGGEWDTSVWDEAEWEQTDTPLGDWLDVTCDCLVPISLGAGSDRGDGVVNRWEAATAQLSFVNGQFNYDPRTGPWAGLVGPALPVRIRWRPLSTVGMPGPPDWRDVFTGVVANGGYEWDPASRTAQLDCTDRTQFLVGVDLPSLEPPIGAGDWASARLHWLAEQADWGPLDRDITSGGVSLIATNADGSIWTQMLDIADSDLGLIWVRRDGRLAYRPEGRVAENVPVLVTLEACPDDAPAPVPVVPVNMLSQRQATFEGGVDGWLPRGTAGNVGIAVDTDTPALEGVTSMRVTRTGAVGGAVDCITAASGVPVTPGQAYTVMASIAPGLTSRRVTLNLWFYDGASALLEPSTAVVDVTLPGNGQWHSLSGSVVAPSGAVIARVRIATTGTAVATGEYLNVDRVGMFRGVTATWVPPRYSPPDSPNLLTANQASAEDGTTGGWTAAAGAALASTTDAADDGTRSVALTTSGAGPYVQFGTTIAASVPVPSGGTVTLMSSVMPAAAGRTCYLGVAWWSDKGGAATFQWGNPVTLGEANKWTRIRQVLAVPDTAVRASLIVSPRGLATGGAERALIDRNGIFAGDVGEWILPGYVPPVPVETTAIGYVDLLHAAPEVLRNWVTVAGEKPAVAEGAPEPPDRPIVTRVDGASVSRFGKVTYSAVDLLHDQDAWSSVVADAILAVGAWPTTAPEAVELDTRTHRQPGEIAAVLLGVEPEHVFTVVDPLDRSVSWRVIPAGWTVGVHVDRVTGSIALEDVSGWSSAAGWDDAAPHGWDTDDTWGLSGWIGGGGGQGPDGPAVSTFDLADVTDIPGIGIPIQVPLIDPGTGAVTYAPTLGAGTYRLDAEVTFAAGWADTCRASLSIAGTQWATGTANPTETAAASVTLVAASVAVPVASPLELTVQTTASPGRVVTPTRVVATRLV